jgi:phospholipid/cholesterol/gamma-HCH transport system ATP-binding protein
MSVPVVEVVDLRTWLAGRWVHDGVSFSLRSGEIVALIGGSGTGKTVLLNQLVGLRQPNGGRVKLFGQDLALQGSRALQTLRRRFGLLFQDGALFSAMRVSENVATPLVEHMPQLPASLREEVVGLKLALVGLPADAASKMPSELSGGMRKRAALARALALEPELLFLDEPTSGLDPISAREFDRTLRVLVDSLGLTVLLTTHDLDSLWGLADRIIVLFGGKVIADGPVQDVVRIEHEWIRSYFDTRALNGTVPSPPTPLM